MKKKLKIIVFNICLILVTILIIEIICFISDYKENIYGPRHRENPIDVRFPENYLKTYTFDESPYDLREPSGLEYKSEPVIIFGCSFAYGDRLDHHQTFSHKLANIIKAPVYNRASCAWGLQHMLHQIRTKDIFNIVKQKPKHIIYIFINNHIYRMYRHTNQFPFNNMLYLHYKFDGNDFKKHNPTFPFLERTSIIGKIHHYEANRKTYEEKYFNKNFDLLKLYFIKSREELEKQYGKINFTIIKYNFEDDEQSKYLETVRWNELKEIGFNVIDTKDLVGRKLNRREDKADDNFHPSEEVWNILTPKIAEELKLF